MIHHDPGHGREAAWFHLDEGDRKTLAPLSVLRGAFATEAAAAVLGVEPGEARARLDALVERSLLQRDGAFHSLDERLCLVAAEALEPAARAEAQRRHARHYLQAGAAWARALDRRGDRAAVERLEREGANLIAIHEIALRRARMVPGAAADAIRAALALEPLHVVRHHPESLLRMLDRSLEATAPASVEATLVARALVARGKARLFLGRPAGALADLRQAVGLAHAAQNRLLETRAQLELSRAHRHQAHHQQAEVACERGFALAQESGDDFLVGRAWLVRALLARGRAEGADAERACLRAMKHQERCGDRRGRGVALAIVGELRASRAEYHEARTHLLEALACFHALDDAANSAAVLQSLGAVCQEEGTLDTCKAAFDEAHALASRVGRRQLAAHIDLLRAGAVMEQGRFARAREVLEGSLATLRVLGDAQGEARGLLLLTCVEVELGDTAGGEAALGGAQRLLRDLGPAGLLRLAGAQGWLLLGQARDHERVGRWSVAQGLRCDAARQLEDARVSCVGPVERLVVRMLARALDPKQLAAGA